MDREAHRHSVARLVDGIAAAHAEYEEQLRRGSALFEDLYLARSSTQH